MADLKWLRSEDGYVNSHCGRWRIVPLFMSCVKPQAFDLYHDDKKVGSMITTQRDAKARAQHLENGWRAPCLECDDESTGADRYEDPRDPPLDLDPCLCRDCAEAAIEEVIEDHEREIKNLKRQLRKLRPQKKG